MNADPFRRILGFSLSAIQEFNEKPGSGRGTFILVLACRHLNCAVIAASGAMEDHMHCIVYQSGYKYQLKQDYTVDIPIRPSEDIGLLHGFISLNTDGKLFIKSGYAWDGPSGPTIDTRNFMRASLVHDALYQLMREGYLDGDIYRKKADLLLREHCMEDGMSAIRAWWVYQGVRFGGGPAADPDKRRQLKHAPKHHSSKEQTIQPIQGNKRVNW